MECPLQWTTVSGASKVFIYNKSVILSQLKTCKLISSYNKEAKASYW